MRMKQILIRIYGGMVQEVYSSDPDVEITICDEDSDVAYPVKVTIDDFNVPEYQVY
jgi:hypothetical protein